MMNRTKWLPPVLCGLIAFAGAAQGETLLLLSGSTITRVDSAAPGVLLASVNITGLQGGEAVLAMDVRPASGQLYALGNTSRLYSVNSVTGIATMVGSAAFIPALNGNVFGFDFDPVSDRIRLVSDAGQNLHLDPNTGTATIDAPLHGAVSAAAAAAYSNNVPGAASTTLYVIDPTTDSLYRQGSVGGIPSSPDDGVLTLIGALSYDTSGVVAFDISSSGVAYAALRVGGLSALFTVDLATGSATQVGSFPAGVGSVLGLAAASSASSCSFDVDGNGNAEALTDGLIILRALLGLTGDSATAHATGANATRTSWTQLRTYMNTYCGTNFGP